MILANGCNITKSEKCKGVWILSVPTVYIYMWKEGINIDSVLMSPKDKNIIIYDIAPSYIFTIEKMIIYFFFYQFSYFQCFMTFVYYICLHHKAEKYLLNQGSWTIVDITNLRAREKRPPKTLIYLQEIKEKAQDLIKSQSKIHHGWHVYIFYNTQHQCIGRNLLIDFLQGWFSVLPDNNGKKTWAEMRCQEISVL